MSVVDARADGVGVVVAEDVRRAPRFLTRPAVLASLAVAAGLAVRLLFFIGYQGHDDRNYLAYADYLTSGGSLRDLDIRNQWIGRLGMWIPVAGTMKALGATPAGYVLYPLACSLLGILLTLKLGASTVGPRAAVLAAALLCVMPLDVLYATAVYPDVPVGLFMVAGYWLALNSRSSSTPFRTGAAAGAMIGVGYLVRETSVLAFVPLAILLPFWSRSHRAALAGVAMAFLMVVAAETAFWQNVKGDPLYRVHATQSGITERNEEAAPRSLIPGPRPFDIRRSDNSLVDAGLMLGASEELGLLYWLVLPLLAVSLVTGDTATRDLRLWLVLLLATILFLPVLDGRYTLGRDPRYLTCLTIPALLLLASYLLRVRSAVRFVVLLGIAGSSLAGILVGWERSRMEPQRTLSQIQHTTGEQMWVGAAYAADLLALGGMDAAPAIGIHTLEQGRGSNSFEAAVLVRPGIPMADSLDQIASGVLVLRDRPGLRAPEGWVRSERIIPAASWPMRYVQQLVRAIGLPHIAPRLAPQGGETASLYRRARG